MLTRIFSGATFFQVSLAMPLANRAVEMAQNEEHDRIDNKRHPRYLVGNDDVGQDFSFTKDFFRKSFKDRCTDAQRWLKVNCHLGKIHQQQKDRQAVKSGKSNSPFRYPGGKFYARKLILGLIPQHEYYCEPFAGGASIFFAKETAKHSILNDLDWEIVNTLKQIRDNVELLIEKFGNIEANKKLHTYYKDMYRPRNNLERAFRWFYLNRTSYSGIMRFENCYWGFGDKYSMRPCNWGPHLRTVSDKLQNTELSSCDFENIIDRQPDESFLFVDPPYYNADQQKFYNCTFSSHDHKRLADCLQRNSTRLKFLLTYDDHNDVRHLYQWVDKIHAHQWNYTINRTDDQKNGRKKKDGYKSKRTKGSEIFIQNYSCGLNV